MERAQLNFLELVYPPVSNQEAEWIHQDEEVRQVCAQSNLYMIGQREEINFRELKISDDENECKFIVETPRASSEVFLDVEGIRKHYNVYAPFELEIEFGKKIIRIWKIGPGDEVKSLVVWYTTEKLLFNRWRGSRFIRGLDNLSSFARYKLHYVGISKKDDSLRRLVVNAHEKRIRILSNETAIRESSRLTDELILFFFKINPLHFKMVGYDADEEMLDKFFDEIICGAVPDYINVVADAEKAFTKILQPGYNSQRFQSYPKGADGLYDAGLARYGFLINEDIVLETDNCEMRGKYFSENIEMMNEADTIFISGDIVEVIGRNQKKDI